LTGSYLDASCYIYTTPRRRPLSCAIIGPAQLQTAVAAGAAALAGVAAAGAGLGGRRSEDAAGGGGLHFRVQIAAACMRRIG
jgi:hypothetical protein